MVVLKRLAVLGFDICNRLGAFPERVEVCLSIIFLLLTIEQCNFHFQICLHSFLSISKMVADIKTKFGMLTTLLQIIDLVSFWPSLSWAIPQNLWINGGFL